MRLNMKRLCSTESFTSAHEQLISVNLNSGSLSLANVKPRDNSYQDGLQTAQLGEQMESSVEVQFSCCPQQVHIFHVCQRAQNDEVTDRAAHVR